MSVCKCAPFLLRLFYANVLKAIAFEEQLFSRSKVSLIPLDIVVQAGKIMQSLNSEDTTLREGLSLLSGIFRMPGSSEKTVLLPWSPLAADSSENTASYSFEDLLRRAKEWIVPKFPEIVAVLDDTLSRLWKLETQKRCIPFITRGKRCEARPSTLHKLTSTFRKLFEQTERLSIRARGSKYRILYLKSKCQWRQPFRKTWANSSKGTIENMLSILPTHATLPPKDHGR